MRIVFFLFPQIDFLFKVIESLSSGNRTLVDAAVESCVYVCRLCTYVNRQDTAVIKYIVTLFQSKLQDVLFNPKKVYVRLTQPAIVGSPPDERELMIHCLIALFRINPRNNYLSMVCLESTSPLLFKLILVRSIHRVVQEVRKGDETKRCLIFIVYREWLSAGGLPLTFSFRFRNS